MAGEGVLTLGSPSDALGLGSSTNLPGTKTSGPRGIEAVFEYNGLYLNVREWIDTILVTSINGFDDADIRDTRDVNPGDHGETPFFSFYGGRTIVLQGKIMARSIFKLRDLQQALRQAFADVSTERPLYIRTNNVDTDLFINCKKSASIQMTEEQKTPNHFERNFSITLRASNPRFLSYKEFVAAMTMAATTSTMDVINDGNFEAQPVIRVTGPINAATNGGIGLTLNNDTNAQPIILKAPVGTTVVLPAANYINIDIAHRTMKEYVTVGDVLVGNAFQKLDIGSDWMLLDPAVNTLTATRTVGSSTPTIQASWHNAYI